MLRFVEPAAEVDGDGFSVDVVLLADLVRRFIKLGLRAADQDDVQPLLRELHAQRPADAVGRARHHSPLPIFPQLLAGAQEVGVDAGEQRERDLVEQDERGRGLEGGRLGQLVHAVADMASGGT